jgi:uncharacterized protein (TIGR03067 family)
MLAFGLVFLKRAKPVPFFPGGCAMKLRAFLVLAVAFLVAADAPKEDVKKEKEKLKGAWKVVSLEVEGKEQKKEEVTFTFADDNLTIAFKDDKKTANYKLEPTTKPTSIDMVPDDGPEKGKTLKGIYVVDGEMLKLCFAKQPDNARPSEFATKKESGSVLIVLKKEKP